MGTASSFDTANAPGLQRSSAGQELGVLLGIDVVGDHRQLQSVTQATTERLHESRLPRADRTGHTHPQTTGRHRLSP